MRGAWALVLAMALARAEPRRVNVRTPPSAVGAPLPSLSLRTLDGSPWQPDGPLVLVFWATWCAPCIRELPAFLDFAREVPPPAVALAVSLDTDAETVRRHFPQGVPPAVARALELEGAQSLGVTTLPHTIILGPDNERRADLAGDRDWASPAVRQEVLQALGAR